MRGLDYIIKRTLFALVTVFVAITINFILFRAAPGTAVANWARAPGITPQAREELTRDFGLDKSKWQQYVIYLEQLAHWNLGISFQDYRPVSVKLRQALVKTIPMAALGTMFAIGFGVLTGVISAWRRRTRTDYASVSTALVFYSLPTQWLGMMLLFATAGLLPSVGSQDPFLVGGFVAHFTDWLKHVTLPALTLGLVLYGQYTLVSRSAMLETLGEDYVLTARAKGLPDRTIVRRHALRNAMLPITTLVALSVGYIVAGSILIERVFSWGGIGQAVYDAVTARDYPMLQGAFLVLTLSVVFCNYVADLVYFKLDPRISG